MRSKTSLILATLMFGGCFLFPTDKSSDPYDSYSTDEEKEFVSVYNNHLKFYVYQSEIAKDMSSYGFSLQAFYQGIKDPYTRYYTPAEAIELNKAYENPVQEGILGFGFQVLHYGDSIADTLQVIRVYANSPAKDMGLKVGDLILRANQHDVTGDSVGFYSKWTEGGVGTQVELKIKRMDSIFDLNGTKRPVMIPTIFVDSISAGISKIQITGFSEQTVEKIEGKITGTWKEFRDALSATASDKATIIDLRGNPGGSVHQCLNIADEFVSANKLMIRIEDRSVSAVPEDVYSTANGLAEARQFVFLADSNSASCSEILLSVIRDNSNFHQVGTRTYGKGIGQGFYGTYLKGYTKITSLRFLNKNNFAYHAVGIPPTDTVMGYDNQLKKALQIIDPSLTRGRKWDLAPSRTWSETEPHFEGGAYLFGSFSQD